MATTLQVAAVLEKSIAEPIQSRWFTPAAKAFALTLSLRIFYSIFAAVSSRYLRLDPNLIHSNSLTGQLMSRESHPLLYALLGVWERFDTLWYIQISAHGYETPIAIVFYPLYPILIRALSFFTHSDLAAPCFCRPSDRFSFSGARCVSSNSTTRLRLHSGRCCFGWRGLPRLPFLRAIRIRF